MQFEVWDAYDAEGTLAGCDLVRGQPIPNGLFHVVSEVLVMHEDGSYLVMQRDHQKDLNPGLYEATAGGSVLKGETCMEGAKRELYEETGIQAAELLPLYRITSHRRKTIYHGYCCIVSGAKDNITLQEKETIAYAWMKEDELYHLMESGCYVSSQKKRMEPYLPKAEEYIAKIEEPASKAQIVGAILADLPEWFGLPESTNAYIEAARSLMLWVMIRQKEAVGFIMLKQTSPHAAEIHCMGVKKAHHRSKVGQRLLEAVQQEAKQNYAFLQVKTVAQGHYPEYDATIAFYKSQGFFELEVFPTLWDSWNPCLILIKTL